MSSVTLSLRPTLEKMVMPTKNSCKVLQFATPQDSIEGELEKWFRGVMKIITI